MRKNYDIFDLTKFILSFFIAAIHLQPLGRYNYLIYPIVRMAVPIFFIISSYLFFNNGANLKKFFCRNMRLYAFWFAALLPVTILRQMITYNRRDIFEIVRHLVINFFFGSTFRVSWYLIALVIGVAVAFYLKKIIGNIGCIIVGLLFYCFCLFGSNYYGLFSDNGVIHLIIEFYPGKVYNSFPAGVIWIAIGSWVSDIELPLKSYKRRLFIISMILLFIEHLVICRTGISLANDCYIMLIPVCTCLFLVLVDVEINIKNCKTFRRWSTVIYCVHASLGYVLMPALRRIGFDYQLLLPSLFSYFLVICFCVVTAEILFLLGKKYTIFTSGY